MTRPIKTMSFDEIRAIPPDGPMYEVLSGETMERETPSKTHELTVHRIHQALTEHVDANDYGAVFRSPWPLELSKLDLVRPDVYFLSWERAAAIRPDGVAGTPELVVEIVSPESSKRDRGEKLRLYAWSAVQEYWLVDPVAKTFEPMRKGRQGFDPIEYTGNSFVSELLPEFTLDLSALFAPR